MKIVSRFLSWLALASALGFAGVLVATSANSQIISPIPGPVPIFGESGGTFHSSAGKHGTYTERVIMEVTGIVGMVEPFDKISEDTIVYKSEAGLTRTVKTTTINHADAATLKVPTITRIRTF